MMNKCVILSTMCMAFFVGYLNADELLECVSCDSTRNINCTQYPKGFILERCNVQSDVTACYTRIVNGQTYRGCLTDLDEGVRRACMNDTAGANCTVCENVNGRRGCNDDIFPAHRLLCHSCEGDLKSDCFNQIKNAIPCKTYHYDDKCYTRKTAKSIERGCLSDTTRCANINHCKICDGDGCNNQDGNDKDIPIAPNSAVMWTSTITLMISLFLSLNTVA